MRDLEFLPSWYGLMRRRKRIVTVQSWALVALVAMLAGWIGLTRRSIASAQASLNVLNQQVDHVHGEQRELAEQLQLQQQLQQRDEMIASLGFPVQVTRLLQTLDSVMPKEMSITEFNCDTIEQPRQNASVAGILPGADKEKQMDRRLDVHIKAVTPSDLDVGNFLAGLASQYSFLEQVTVTGTKDRIDAGHVMHEFEVTFSINLSQR